MNTILVDADNTIKTSSDQLIAAQSDMISFLKKTIDDKNKEIKLLLDEISRLRGES